LLHRVVDNVRLSRSGHNHSAATRLVRCIQRSLDGRPAIRFVIHNGPEVRDVEFLGKQRAACENDNQCGEPPDNSHCQLLLAVSL